MDVSFTGRSGFITVVAGSAIKFLKEVVTSKVAAATGAATTGAVVTKGAAVATAAKGAVAASFIANPGAWVVGGIGLAVAGGAGIAKMCKKKPDAAQQLKPTIKPKH